jgi:hypothetical protein
MRKIYFGFLLCFIGTTFVCGQNVSNGELAKYRRNSLATMMVYHEGDSFANELQTAFLAIPIPDKYDDHNIGVRVLDNRHLNLKTAWGRALNKKEVQLNNSKITEYLNSQDCAKAMVARWFNYDPDNNTFNTKLLAERGNYNATELDVANAQNTVRGVAMLADAGEELLHNTFVVVNDISYVNKEEQAALAQAIIEGTVGILGALLGMEKEAKEITNLSKDITDMVSGFKVRTNSYLYQLEWNDSVAAIFYEKYYTETPDPVKIQAFIDDKTTFRMVPAATEYEYDSKGALRGTYDQSELIKTVCTRSLDKNIAALQLQYEDFKIKTPIYEIVVNDKGKIQGIAAKVGLKEGVTPKSSYQVLEQSVDEEGRTMYRKIATLKPEKDKIWDNRYMATEEKDEGSDLSYTLFKKSGGGEVYPGMLIIEGKYKKAK